MPLTIEERLENLETRVQNADTFAARFWKGLKEIGLFALTGIALVTVILYLSTKAQLEKANQKLMDVYGQMAIAEDHLKQLQLRIDKGSDLAARLEKVDAERVKAVLD